MGLITCQLKLYNAARNDIAPMDVPALVDTGAVHLCVPEHVATQLQLTDYSPREVTIADGSSRLVRYVGPLRVQFANRECLVGALVLGDQVLLGAVPMEDMDVVIHPARQTIVVNPANPNIAVSIAKTARLS